MPKQAENGSWPGAVYVPGFEFDKEAKSTASGYESVDFDGVPQDSNGWIDVLEFIRMSLFAKANSQAQDVKVEYKFSEKDTAQQLVETTNIAAGTRSEVLIARDIEDAAKVRVLAKFNSTSGGSVDLGGNFK